MAKSKPLQTEKKPLSEQITRRFMIVCGEIMMLQRRAGGVAKTRAGLSSTLNMQKNAFNHFENGVMVSLENVAMLCKVYGINGQWILTGEGEKYYSQDLKSKIERIEQRLDILEKKTLKAP